MAGQILIQRGAVGAGGGGGTPGGSDTQVQYNDGGAFGGDAGLTFNETTNALTVGGALSAASATLTGLTTNAFLYSGTSGLLTTTAAPTDGQLLIGSTGAAPVRATLTAGANVTITNGAGSIQIAAAGGSGSPGGADTQVQFNDGGAFGGDGGLTFNKTTNRLTVTGGNLEVNGAADMELSGDNIGFGYWGIGRVGFTLANYVLASDNTDVLLNCASGGSLRLRQSNNDVVIVGNGTVLFGSATTVTWQNFTDMLEIATPASPAANHGRVFMRDVAGKTQFAVLFPTGAVQVIATEP